MTPLDLSDEEKKCIYLALLIENFATASEKIFTKGFVNFLKLCPTQVVLELRQFVEYYS